MSTGTALAHIHVEQLGTTLLQSGTMLKSTPGAHEIQFRQPFASPPVVVISPFWNGSGGGVGYIETITSINENAFVVNSSNAATNYYVTWIAVGRAS
jgi:hypothetical protein